MSSVALSMKRESDSSYERTARPLLELRDDAGEELHARIASSVAGGRRPDLFRARSISAATERDVPGGSEARKTSTPRRPSRSARALVRRP